MTRFDDRLRSARILVLIELGLVVFAILGGAAVRASGSGAGCGESWPLCHGQVIPWSRDVETIIEFTHRLISGLSLLGFFYLWSVIRKLLTSKHPVQNWCVLALVAFVLEVGVGAFLVLKSLVTTDTSVLRVVVIALHLANTYLLLAALVGIYVNLREGVSIRISDLSRQSYMLMCLWMIVGASGAIVALGDTLFPAESLAHGWQQEWDASSHFLVRIRASHPILAVGASFLTFLVIRPPHTGVLCSATAVRALVFTQVLFGFTNWILLAPLWSQLVHLALADALWCAIVLNACNRASAPSSVVKREI